MKKYAFGLLVAAMSLQTSVAFAFGFGCCCEKVCGGNNFDGFYIGGNLGVLTHTAFRQDFDGFIGASRTGWTSNNSAFTGGAQIGYDYACNGSVLGLVWDFNGSTSDARFARTASTNTYIHNRHHWLSTLRGRAGITVCDALFYVTAGLAVVNTRTRWNSGVDFLSHKHTRYGWTAGVGSEFIACDNWTFGFDILAMQFDNEQKKFTTGLTAPRTVRLGVSDQIWAGRFILNYRFEDLCCCW